ncbi:hypothetical protein [Streptomyces sp. 11-1-2]|uniref:hypothetical protein n=1 Tax=unclassified Streptomyces TaxID=2593676 RepID=UPI001968D7FC|nr:hypothetical protein [Streptomyces sp. 11-1-2]
MVADDAQDRVPDLAEGQVAVAFFLASGIVTGVGGEGKLEIGAQNIDARLAQPVVGCVVSKAGKGVNATEPDGRGVGAELFDGLGEALGMEPGGLPVSAYLVDALATVGNDQGDERAGPGDHSEGELHQVEKRLRVELGGAVDPPEAQKDHQTVEDTARDTNAATKVTAKARPTLHSRSSWSFGVGRGRRLAVMKVETTLGDLRLQWAVEAGARENDPASPSDWIGV